MQLYICVKGHLDPEWQDWFGGLEIRHEQDGTSLLSGVLPDQAALYGVLFTLRRLNLALLELSTDEAAKSKKQP